MFSPLPNSAPRTERGGLQSVSQQGDTDAVAETLPTGLQETKP